MDDVNRFARELADAIAAAVADHPKVEACRERARAAGYEMRVSLEAVVGFVSRDKAAAAPGKPAADLYVDDRGVGFDWELRDRWADQARVRKGRKRDDRPAVVVSRREA